MIRVLLGFKLVIFLMRYSLLFRR